MDLIYLNYMFFFFFFFFFALPFIIRLNLPNALILNMEFEKKVQQITKRTLNHSQIVENVYVVSPVIHVYYKQQL